MHNIKNFAAFLFLTLTLTAALSAPAEAKQTYNKQANIMAMQMYAQQLQQNGQLPYQPGAYNPYAQGYQNYQAPLYGNTVAPWYQQSYYPQQNYLQGYAQPYPAQYNQYAQYGPYGSYSQNQYGQGNSFLGNLLNRYF